MQLTDMKRPKRKRKTGEDIPEPYYESDKYPYGLKLRFEADEVKKMPELKKLSTGDTVSIQGLGKVVSTRIEESTNQNSHTVEIQVQRVSIDRKKKLAEMDMKEYTKERTK